MFSVNSYAKSFCFNHTTRCAIFDTYVSSVLNYGCEIWGFHKARDIEKLHVMFCKHTLGVRQSTNNILVYCELGRCPLIINRKLRIFKYWSKLVRSENTKLRALYNDMIVNNDP